MAAARKPPAQAYTTADFLKIAARIFVVLLGSYVAFDIRMIAIREYGRIIHECVVQYLARVSLLPKNIARKCEICNKGATPPSAPSEAHVAKMLTPCCKLLSFLC